MEKIIENSEISQKNPEKSSTTAIFKIFVSCLLIITILATLYTFYFAAQIILPIVLAIALALLLQVPFRFLNKKLHIPRFLAALLLTLSLFGIVGAIATAISVPAAGWLAKAPESLPALQKKLAPLSRPIRAFQKGYERIHDQMGMNQSQTSNAPNFQQHSGVGSFGGVGRSVLLSTRDLLSGMFTMMLTLFFLLMQGDTLMRRWLEVIPNAKNKDNASKIVVQIEQNISTYLAIITVMNILVGSANLVQCWLLGIPNPLLWGVLAFLFNYIPIIGPLFGIVIYFFVGVFTFSSIWQMFLPPLIYFLIHLIEGECVTPMLLAKRYTLNPLLVIVFLLFWDWLWGTVGAFLAVPLLMVLKIVCDHIDSLKALGYVMEGDSKKVLKKPSSTKEN